jgi:hypothetical protein
MDETKDLAEKYNKIAQVLTDAGISFVHKGKTITKFDIGGILLVSSTTDCPITGKIISHALDHPDKTDEELISDTDDMMTKYIEEEMNINGSMN